MKIVHVIIAAVYKEGFGYQENILPAKHVELGFDTYIVSCNKEHPKGVDYVNQDGIKVALLPINKPKFAKFKYSALFSKKTKGLYNYLEKQSPDIIFVHGLQAIDILEVCNWCKKNNNVKLYVDQHADYYNSPINKLSTRLYFKIVFGYIAKRLSKYTLKFWGVTPWRVDYLQNVYGIKREKTDLLVMGGDERLIDWDNRSIIKKQIRDRYNIPQDAFLIISGGKIDKTKNIHLLIDAVEKIKNSNAYLLVFGNMTDDMKEYCTPKFKDNIRYAGWIDSKQVYPLFLASDLAVFPGTHSVLWEQAIACGLPGIFKDWDGGFSHVDCGGNAILIKDITEGNIEQEIRYLIDNKLIYKRMKDIAENRARETFLYINIAKKAIGIGETI